MIRDSRQTDSLDSGFTLIEMMIAVAIVGILAGVAVVAYGKHIKSARILEGKAFLQLLQGRQESYFQMHGQYCFASKTGKHPGLVSSSEPMEKKWAPATSSSWMDLNARPNKGVTYFQWTVVASDPSANPSHALDSMANSMGIPDQPAAPGVPHPWYYMLGEADMDGSGTPYTELRISSTRSQIITLNEGK